MSFQVSICVYAISFSLPCKEQFRENLTMSPQLFAPYTAETQFPFRQIPNPSSSLLRYPERESEKEMASALRSAMLRHIRVPVTETLTLNGSKWNLFNNVRSMSSHDDHITKEEVIHRVLDVVKSFPKVDPSKVGHSVIQRFLFHFPHSIYSCLVADKMYENKKLRIEMNAFVLLHHLQ